MQTLENLSNQGIDLEINPKERINESVLRRQINFNGSLNDYNIYNLPDITFTSPLKSIKVDIRNLPEEEKEVTLYLKNEMNTFIPFCDFPLANCEEEITLNNQLLKMKEHLARKYLTDLNLEFGKIEFSSRKLGKIEIDKQKSKLNLSLNKIALGHNYPSTLWDEYVFGDFSEENPNHAELYKRIFYFQNDLVDNFNSLSVKPEGFFPFFSNLSNMRCMIYENHDKKQKFQDYKVYSRREGRSHIVSLPDLDEKIYFNYNILPNLRSNKDNVNVNLSG